MYGWVTQINIALFLRPYLQVYVITTGSGCPTPFEHSGVRNEASVSLPSLANELTLLRSLIIVAMHFFFLK